MAVLRPPDYGNADYSMRDLPGATQVLEIGGGDARIPGARQFDCSPQPIDPHCGVWGVDMLPFPNESFDLVYASHVLEHVEWNRTEFALSEALRVLRPTGWIEIWVPDFAYIVRCYLERRGWWEDNWQDAADNPHADFMTWVCARLFAKSKRPGDPNCHRAAFDEEYLRRCLHRAGFVNMRRITLTRTRDHGVIQLGMGAERPS